MWCGTKPSYLQSELPLGLLEEVERKKRHEVDGKIRQ